MVIFHQDVIYHKVMQGDKLVALVTNHDQMRLTNTVSVLNCIREYGPLTKRELQDKTGLSWGSISSITADLLHQKIIVECQKQSPYPGRNPKDLDISNLNNLLIGIDIRAEGITGVLTDLKCQIITKQKVKVMIDNNEAKNYPELILAHIRNMINGFIAAHSSKRIIGIGLAVQGAVDAERGISLFSPHIPGWTNIHLKELLEAEFKLPTLVEHDPNCMALAERWLTGIKNVKNMLLIRLTHGIGMSILINGEIYRGANGSAGEFGHTVMNTNGPKCTCGNFGCLETYASGWSLLQKVEEAMKLGRMNLPDNIDKLDLDTIINAALHEEPYLKQLFEEMGIYLGVGISNLINILNPDIVIIGGELSKCNRLFMDKMQEMIAHNVWKSSKYAIRLAEVESEFAAAIGAAALFVQRIYSGELQFIMT